MTLPTDECHQLPQDRLLILGFLDDDSFLRGSRESRADAAKLKLEVLDSGNLKKGVIDEVSMT